MSNRILYALLATSAFVAGPLAAQDTTNVPKPAPDTAARSPEPAAEASAPTSGAVAPGMTEADVISRWGKPVTVRTANNWTYLFYDNGREHEVGTYDVVFLQGGKVVDAIVRSPAHVYEGQSSSPEGKTPAFTPPARPGEAAAGGAVTGVRVQPGP